MRRIIILAILTLIACIEVAQAATVQAHFEKTYPFANGSSNQIQLDYLSSVSNAYVTFRTKGGYTFDNSGGGSWKACMVFPLTAPTTEYAQYKIVISGTTWEIYNAEGNLKVSGTNSNFWSLVNSTGADIRVFNDSGNQMYFWIEKWDYTNQTAIIWVNLTAGSSELNIAYGNPSALPSSYNDISKTFIYGDDFEDGVLGFDWYPYGSPPTNDPSGWSEANGIVTHNMTVDNTHMLALKNITLSSGVYMVKINLGTLQEIEEAGLVWCSSPTDPLGNRYFARYIYYPTANRVQWELMKIVRGTATTLATYPYSLSANTWCWIKVVFDASTGSIKAYFSTDGVTWTLWADVTDTSLTSGYFGLHSAFDIYTVHSYDNLIVAKLADPANFGTPEVLPLQNATNPTLSLNSNNVTYVGDLNATNPSVTLAVNSSYFISGTNWANFTANSGNFNAIIKFDYVLDVPQTEIVTYDYMWVNLSTFTIPDGTTTSNTTVEFNTSAVGVPIYKFYLKVYVNGAEYSNYKYYSNEVNGVQYITVYIADLPPGSVTVSVKAVFTPATVNVTVYDELTNSPITNHGILNVTLFDANYNVLATSNINTSVTSNATLKVVFEGKAYLRVTDSNGVVRQIGVYVPSGGNVSAKIYFPTQNIILVQLQIIDYTNTFRGGDVIIKKFITRDKLTEIDRQKLTADMKTSHYLIANEPYTVYVTNGQETRTVGYISSPTSTSITLTIQTPLNFTPINYAPVIYNITNNNGIITIQYKTLKGTTSYAKVEIYNSSGALVFTADATTPEGKFTFIGSPNETYTVHFIAQNSMEAVEFRVIVGANAKIFINVQIIKQLPEWLRTMFFGGLCLFVAMLFKRSHVPVGLLLSFSLAAVFTAMGILPLGQGLLWVLALIVGLSFFVWWRDRR